MVAERRKRTRGKGGQQEEARFGDQARKGGTKVNLFPGNAKSLRGGKMFSAALFVLIDCQFARCPHLSGDRRYASE